MQQIGKVNLSRRQVSKLIRRDRYYMLWWNSAMGVKALLHGVVRITEISSVLAINNSFQMGTCALALAAKLAECMSLPRHSVSWLILTVLDRVRRSAVL